MTKNNAIAFILDSLPDHSLRDIEFLDEMTALEFGGDYEFSLDELNSALDQFRAIPLTHFNSAHPEFPTKCNNTNCCK